MMGKSVRDGDLQKDRGTELKASVPDLSVQPERGYAVILWDELGGKPGGGRDRLDQNTTVNVAENDK